MKYYLIAGERSGDLHGANLIRGLLKEDPDAVLRGWGGDRMQAAGMELVTHYRDTSFMGFLEVARNLLSIQKLLKKCREDILEFRPDALILIDYPGFNLRMASFAKRQGLKVLYYISPKVWAWNQSRALKIKAVVDRMFVIFPFEIDFYRQYRYDVEYVGNPLMDAIHEFVPDPDFSERHQLTGKKLIALLPGSRKQEVTAMLESMVSVIPHLPGYHFVIAAVSNLDEAVYASYRSSESLTVVEDETYNVLHLAEAALVASGTATLETALLKVPEVVCYKTSHLSYLIAKRLIRVPYISLVNLISGREIVRELIQEQLTTGNLVKELQAIVTGGSGRERMLQDFDELAETVGGPGASEKAGEKMVKYARK